MGKRLKVRRKEDSLIRDHVIASNFSTRKINMANMVQYHLQVETEAEISNSDGAKIDQRWHREGPKPSRSTEKWPEVRTPSEKMWQAWREAISLITQGDGKLRRALGRWHEPSEKREYEWMQDCVSICSIRENESRKHMIKTKTRREITFEEE